MLGLFLAHFVMRIWAVEGVEWMCGDLGFVRSVGVWACVRSALVRRGRPLGNAWVECKGLHVDCIVC